MFSHLACPELFSSVTIVLESDVQHTSLAAIPNVALFTHTQMPPPVASTHTSILAGI